MAKTGNIASPSGADPNIRALGDTNPVTSTLAGIARQALAVTPVIKKAVINLENRTVTIVPSDTNTDALCGALTAGAQFTKDDPTKASSPMTANNAPGNAFGAALEALPAAAKPAMSVESLVNRLEDLMTDPEGVFANNGGVIVVDQVNNEVKAFYGTHAEAAAVDATQGIAEDAHFTQTLVGAGGAQFGE